ncbi:MAG: FecR domain-containing protein, partial [Campylobacterota bacterium]|nr:FecR domain-containing protein [Campylobacterota bacterium]
MSSVLLIADIGNITLVKGKAFVIRDIQELPAHHPMPLLKQDIIETKDGRLQMQFIDNTVISLGKDSRFHIREYFYEENSDQLVASFEIEKGFVKTITGLIGKLMPEVFVLSTRTTDIRPHGTIWSIDVHDSREEYRVIEGSITLTFNDGEERTVEVHAGESMLLELDSKDLKKIAKSLKMDIKTTEFEKYIKRENASIVEDRQLNRIIEQAVEPEVIEPEVIEPEVIEPEVIEPEVIEPEVIEPEVIEPEVIEP